MIKKARRDIRTLVTGFAGFSDFDYVELEAADWRYIEQKLRITIPRDLRNQLSILTMLFLYGSYANLPRTSLTKARKDLALWTNRTRALRNGLWKRKPAKAGKEKTRVGLKTIISKHFHLRRDLITALFPLARFAQFLDGAVEIGQYFIKEIENEKPNKNGAEWWLIWAGLIIGICREKRIPVTRGPKNAFTPGFLTMLEKLQNTRFTQAKRAGGTKQIKKRPADPKPLLKTGQSLQKAARRALVVAEDNSVDDLSTLFILKSLGLAGVANFIRTDSGAGTIQSRLNEQLSTRRRSSGMA